MHTNFPFSDFQYSLRNHTLFNHSPAPATNNSHKKNHSTNVHPTCTYLAYVCVETSAAAGPAVVAAPAAVRSS